MGVSTRKRRQITVDDRRYVWYVRQEEDDDFESLTIISDDKRVLVRFPVPRPGDAPLAVAIGSRFGGLHRDDGCFRYVEAPSDCWKAAITPGRVRRLVDWILDESKQVTETARRR